MTKQTVFTFQSYTENIRLFCSYSVLFAKNIRRQISKAAKHPFSKHYDSLILRELSVESTLYKTEK